MKRTFILLMSLFAMMAAGAGLSAQEITITLNPGWNWISYPNAAAMQVDEALGDFVPMEGDMIKSQNSFASYYSGSWSGGLTQFTPGWGYMYYSARTAPVLFAFSSPSTPVGALSVTTSAPADITATTVILGGSAVSNDGTSMLMKGICWATHPLPTTYDAYSENGSDSGAFTEELSELTPNTVYYVRAYAVSVKGVNYGIEVSFTTESDGSSEHEYVDLGLPSGTLWATCNIGASTPEGYGDYFAWGETQPKDEYSWNTYQYCNGNETTLTKYCSNSDYGYNGFTDNLTTLLPEDDAATATWGEDWRMPTKAEWQELYNNTTCTWTTQNGVAGRLFTASNGNSIFLPAAGLRYVSSSYEVGSDGYYWSGTLDTDVPYNAWYLDFNSGSYGMGYFYGRSFGRSVRAVYSETQNNDTPTGAINGKFTINEEGDQVYFSQGNLQYIGSAATPYWKFADNQWDYFGTTTGQNSNAENVDRDLFGWGTSGYHDSNDPYNVNYQPWSISSTTVNTSYNYYGYGPSANMDSPDLTGSSANYDWGVYNPISNGGNIANQWRTLTKAEWNYVFSTRSTASGIRYVAAQVNDVKGFILLPDDWSTSYYTLNSGSNFSNNTITAEQWSTLEQYGAVFLPAAGRRNGTSLYNVGSSGLYWTASSSNNSSDASGVTVSASGYSGGTIPHRFSGISVRLVRDVE